MASKIADRAQSSSGAALAHLGDASPGGPDRNLPEEELRQLRLDNVDLRFECARLKEAVARAQAENLALSEQNGVLRRRLDRIHRLAPGWSAPLIRALLRRLRRR